MKKVASLPVNGHDEKTRQLGSSSVPVASSGLASGAANTVGISSPALAQQLQTALQTNPTNAMAELNAQKQETTTLQVQHQQQAMLAAIQAQQQQMAAAQYALSGSLATRSISAPEPFNILVIGWKFNLELIFLDSVRSNFIYFLQRSAVNILTVCFAGQRPGATLVGGAMAAPTGANLQVQQQLMEQQQKLKIQQELLQREQNPNALLAGNQQSILMAQMMANRNPANFQQQLEQIRQQQSKQQVSQLLHSQYPTFSSSLTPDISRNGVGGLLALQSNPMAAMSMYHPAVAAMQQQQLMLQLMLLKQQQQQQQQAYLLGLYGK